MKAKIALRALPVLLALPALARANPSVSSDSDCPSAAAVTAALADLLPPGDSAFAQARIHTRDDHQEIVFSSEGQATHSRELRQEPSCEARAQTAALIMAAWMDAIPIAALGAPEITAPPAQAPARTREKIPVTTSRGRSVWLGLGVLGMLDEAGMDGGLTTEVHVERVVADLGVAVTLSSTLARDVRVGQGSARWWRPALEAPLRLPLLTGGWNLEASLGPVFGLVVLQGHGYDRNTKDVVHSWGVGAGLRAIRTWGQARLWIELRGRLWPESQRIRNAVQDSNVRRTEELPHWDGYVGLGFSLAPT